jgi:hypothetical protein
VTQKFKISGKLRYFRLIVKTEKGLSEKHTWLTIFYIFWKELKFEWNPEETNCRKMVDRIGRIYSDITWTIGNMPLVRLNNMTTGLHDDGIPKRQGQEKGSEHWRDRKS